VIAILDPAGFVKTALGRLRYHDRLHGTREGYSTALWLSAWPGAGFVLCLETVTALAFVTPLGAPKVHCRTSNQVEVKAAMKRFAFVTVLLTLLLGCSLIGVAAPKPAKDIPLLPKTLRNARFVYVASYDGDAFDPNLLPEDREAISAVQDAIQKWGKLYLVYRPDEADIILRVQSRPSEDVLAVYDGHQSGAQYLWRVMGRGGLEKNETPLVTEFLQAFELSQK
jgi:hypothetical protein